jgi:hypothetical protein
VAKVSLTKRRVTVRNSMLRVPEKKKRIERKKEHLTLFYCLKNVMEFIGPSNGLLEWILVCKEWKKNMEKPIFKLFLRKCPLSHSSRLNIWCLYLEIKVIFYIESV